MQRLRVYALGLSHPCGCRSTLLSPERAIVQVEGERVSGDPPLFAQAAHPIPRHQFRHLTYST